MSANNTPVGLLKAAPSVRARQYAAIQSLINGESRSLRAAAKEHGISRESLGDQWHALINSGLLATSTVGKSEQDALASAANDVIGSLCKLAKGCVESLQALPTRPHEMDGMQMKQLKLSLDTLDRLGLLPNKAKDVAKKEGTGRLIDLVPMSELLAEPDDEQPAPSSESEA